MLERKGGGIGWRVITNIHTCRKSNDNYDLIDLLPTDVVERCSLVQSQKAQVSPINNMPESKIQLPFN